MRLEKLGNSLHGLEVGSRTYYFSYETLIAVYESEGSFHISENEWGVTTGKHLNSINPDKKVRIPHAELMEKYSDLL